MMRIMMIIAVLLWACSLASGEIPPPPKKFRGMLPNGKPFIATMYYERYYAFPDEYSLMDRDLEDLAARDWPVAYTDYIHLSLGPVWDHYYETAARLGIYVLPNQWNAAFHAGGPFFSRTTPPITETGNPPTGFCTGCVARYTDPKFVEAMVDYQAQVLSQYIDHPAYPRILGPDGKSHPLMIVIYETGMCDYDGHWLEYSPDTKQQWVEFQKERMGRVISAEPPKPSETGMESALVLWNEFRAKYISDGWGAVARGLKKRFPGLYAMVCFRQHGLLEGSKSGVAAGGIGRRAIRPELWRDFDIVSSEHDGDDGLEYVLADADLMKSAANGRMGALVYYLDSGYKAWTARPVKFHRPWGQSEMLGSLSIRGLLPLHYGYNERDDRAGIASIGRREKDAPMWREASCVEAAEANRVFLQVAPYVCAARRVPVRAAIVMPYDAYALNSADELPLDRSLVGIWRRFFERDIPVDWLFSSSTKTVAYRLLVVPEAPYSKAFERAILRAEEAGAEVVRLPYANGGWDPGALAGTLLRLGGDLRASRPARKPDVETGKLIGEGYEVEVIVNHGRSPVSYAVGGPCKAFPADALSDDRLTVPGHRTVWLVR
jgi:hypothetical protein